MENKNAVNWTPTNGEKVWVKVFSNWSSGTYIGFDTINNVHVAREDDAGGGYMLVSKDILPFTSNPNTKQTAVQKNNMTAVQFLLDKIIKSNASKSGDVVLHGYLSNTDIEQAKRMEKEQSEEICLSVIERILDKLEKGETVKSKDIFEQYYNQTHGK